MEGLDNENRDIVAAFRQQADLHPGNTERTKAYCCAVLEELGAWLQQQTHRPEIRSLQALQQLYRSGDRASVQHARNLARQFDASKAAPVRMGERKSKLVEIVATLAEPAGHPLALPPSGISRPAERLLHACRTIARSQGTLAKDAINVRIPALRAMSNWLEDRAQQTQPILNDLDSLEKLLRHADPTAVQQVIEAFKQDPANRWAVIPIQAAVTSFRDFIQQSDMQSAALRAAEEALFNEDADMLPLPDHPGGLETAIPAIESTLLASLQDTDAASSSRPGTLSDHEVLAAFRQQADLHPGNTERTKAYCCAVLEELGAWLQQQTHRPEIRSLQALQQLYRSGDRASVQHARNLARQFDASKAAPVRMGERKSKLVEIVATLAEPAGHPLALPPSGISRPAERLLHACRTIARSQGTLAKDAINVRIPALRAMSNWLEDRAQQTQPILNDLDSLEKLLRHADPTAVQQVIEAFKQDPANQRAVKTIQLAVTDFRKFIQQSDMQSAAPHAVEEALFNDEDADTLPLPDHPSAPQAALLALENDFQTQILSDLPDGTHGRNHATSAPASIPVPAPVAPEAGLSGVRRPARETPAEMRRVRPRGNSPPLSDAPAPFASPRPLQSALQRQLLSQAAAFSSRPTWQDMADENDSNSPAP